MINRLKKAKAKMTSEQEILFNRLLLGTPSGFIGHFIGASNFIMTAFLVYLSVNVSLLLMRNRQIWRPKYRLACGLAMDMVMVFVLMMKDAASMSVFFPMMLWVILGHGFRLGLGWLLFATLASTLAFGTVVMTTDFWAQNQVLGYSLLITLIIIPAYCSTLIKKISLAKEQAEVANEAKSHFLASVSHELRTPLNAVIGYGNLLKESHLDGSQKQMVEASILAGEHLLHLFDQLIQVSRSDKNVGAQKSSDFRPSELLSGVRDIMSVRAEDKGIYLRFQAAPFSDNPVRGQEETIRNILMNLISNAIKFTESGGVSVTMRITEKDDAKHLEFDVADTGIGIAAEAQQHIFKAFQQADDSVSSRFGGTGLGLAICSDLLKQISGDISVSSKLGSGSCFSVSVPLTEATEVRREEQSSTVHNSADNNSSSTRIVCFGRFQSNILKNISEFDGINLLQIDCRNKPEFTTALEKTNMHDFDVALVDQRLVIDADGSDPVWEYFGKTSVAPVLVKHDSDFDLEDISLRAAFASIIPADAEFDEMRSAIRIGCSFAKMNFIETEEVSTNANVDTSPRSILVADDNRTNRNIMQTVLSAAGHKVTMVEDGVETLDALEKQKFDVLLLDVNMPRLGGLEACRMWRQIEGGRSRLPIIGVTADATEETRQECLNAGMDMRVTKPIDAKALLNTIAEQCGEQQGFAAEEALVKPEATNKVVNIKPSEDSDTGNTAPDINPAQVEYLRSIGDQNFLNVMVAGYNDDIEQNMPNFQKSVEDGDVTKFRFYAHAFKSSANNIGAQNLASLCHKLESITEADFQENSQALLAEVEARIDAAKEELERLLSADQLPTAAA